MEKNAARKHGFRTALDITRGYFVDGVQQAPFITVTKCPDCGEYLTKRTHPVAGSGLLTALCHYNRMYDTLDRHLDEKHGRFFNMNRRYYIRTRVKSYFVRLYGRETTWPRNRK